MGCVGCTRVNPGYVGIKVHMSGSDRGVENSPALTGWVWYNPISTTVYKYPTFVQTAVWTQDKNEGNPINEEISFGSSEGMIVTGDISLSYQLDPLRVPHFYATFRNDDIRGFTHGFLRNMARDVFANVSSRYPVADIYGPKKEMFLRDVRKELNDKVSGYGVSIDQFGFIGALRLPAGVMQNLNAAAAATQQAIQSENELRVAKAEAQKKIAEADGEGKALLIKAESEAKANKLKASSINPVLIQYMLAETWDGHLPQVTGGATPLLNLK